MKSAFRTVSLAVVLIIAFGCGAKKEGNQGGGGVAKPAAPAKPGAETPEKAFEVLKKAFSEKGQAGDSLLVVVPKQKNVLPLFMVVSCGFAAASGKVEGAAEELKKFLADHGLKVPEGGKTLVDMNAFENPEKLVAEADRIFKGLDSAKFLTATTAFMARHSNRNEMAQAFSSIGEIKTEGDTASGEVSVGNGKKPMSFLKIDGRWYVDIIKFMD